MVSDADLVGGIRNFLRSADLKKTTVSIVRRKLEDDFGVDLSQRKPFIRQQVEIFIYNHVQEESDDEAEEYGGSDSDRNDDATDSDEDGIGDVTPVVLEHKANGGPSGSKDSSRRSSENGKKMVIRSKSCSLSPQLQKFLGASQMLRYEVLNQLWDYVSQHNLIDPNDKQNILCDERFQGLFGVESFKICQMNTFLSKHLSAAAKPSRKQKPQKQERAELEDKTEQNPGEKRQKRVVTSGFLSPSPISQSFINFLGTGEMALTRPDAIKRVWNYIKKHKLQDPLNKKTILCDAKLKELFEVDSFHGFTVSKLLSAHFVKQYRMPFSRVNLPMPLPSL
ncbi:hypothetical protein V2J09_009550 [Rumex salicifolius]